MATSTTALVTTNQFLAQQEHYDSRGNRIKDELIRGEIVPMAPPSKAHDLIKNRISRAIVLFLAGRPELGLGVYVEMAYAVSGHDTFVPDVSVIRESRIEESESRILTGAPEIAIEVISPTDTAAHVRAKIASYLANGAQSVWIVYPEDHCVVIHDKQGLREMGGEQALEDSLLPGFRCSLRDCFQGL